jgi:hypothetical protein
MTVKQLIDKLQGFPQDWPVAVRVYDKANELFEPDVGKFQYNGTDLDETSEDLYDGQQVVSL